MKDKIILIGGAPCTGKSTLAKNLSQELKIPWISTDTIRTIMQGTVSRSEYPDLFTSYDITAEQFYEKYYNRDIFQMELKECAIVQKGLGTLIENDYEWNSYIVEGIAITPEFVSKIKNKTDKNILPYFIYDLDKDRIKKIIFERGLWDDADTYPDYIKEYEIEWVYEGNEWFKGEAEKHNYPLFSVDDREKLFSKLTKLINS